MVVAIDGPAGSGKSSLAKMVADRFGFVLLDTGAAYRVLALACLEAGVDLDDEYAVGKAASRADARVGYDGVHVSLDGKDVTARIRSADVDDASSRISRFLTVRTIVARRLRKVADAKDVVAEGRDMTTAVFPNAQVKVFLEADVFVRARRRLLQRGFKPTEDAIEEEVFKLKARDERDGGRALAPMYCPEDACKIDMGVVALEEAASAVAMMVEAAL